MRRTMKSGITLFATLVLSGCIGSNDDAPTQPDEYPDKGRTTIDPIPPGVLCLSFDDGPSGELSPGIIDLLAQHGVSAIFFVIGRNIPGNRGVLDHARAQGHQVANHSMYHLPQPSLSEGVFQHRTRAVKANIGDRDNGRLFYRFPYGAAGDEQLRWLKELTFDGASYRVVGWNIDSQDWDFGAQYPPRECSTAVLGDSESCNGQLNPWSGAVRGATGDYVCVPGTPSGDFVGWTQFIARKKQGGVMLFHDIQRITFDKLDRILTYLKDPDAYWASLDPTTRDAYQRYYQCESVDPQMAFKFQALHSGAWPSYAD